MNILGLDSVIKVPKDIASSYLNGAITYDTLYRQIRDYLESKIIDKDVEQLYLIDKAAADRHVFSSLANYQTKTNKSLDELMQESEMSIREALEKDIISINTYYEDNVKHINVETPTGKTSYELDRFADSKLKNLAIEAENLSPKANTPTVVKKDTPKGKKRRKFKIGEHYYLYPMKNHLLKCEYVVKKTINQICGVNVGVVIMKQLSGVSGNKFTLTKNDCANFHIKFEEGLEICSMDLDWKPIKKK